MYKFRIWIACGALFIGIAMVPGPKDAQARAQYQKVFQKVYPDMADGKCAVCHFGEKKSNRNDYGKAVEETLGEKNVKDEKTIEAALKKAEGKLPGKKP